MEFFQICGILLVSSEALMVLVRALMAIGPRCFRCSDVMLSGPFAVLFLECLMAFLTCVGVKTGVLCFLSFPIVRVVLRASWFGVGV